MTSPTQDRADQPEYMPDFTLERQIAEAREKMGERRWAMLMAEWDEENEE